MMETLEQQQQTQSTPNIEPDAGETGTTPTASEEDDFEDNSDACQLEKKEKSKDLPVSQLAEMKVNNIAKAELAMQNGAAKEEATAAPEETTTEQDETLNCVKSEFKEDEEPTAAAIPAEQPSAVLVEDEIKPAIDIKTEEETALLANNCKSDESVKIVEDYESEDEGTATCSTAMDEEKMETDIKREAANASPNCNNDNETNLSTNSPAEEGMPSPVLVLDSQDEENSPPIVNAVHTDSQEGDTSSATELKLEQEVKSDVLSITEEEGEGEEGNVAETTSEHKKEENDAEEQLAAIPTEAAAATEEEVFKINDLSPASIPDDEESLKDFNTHEKSEKLESQMQMEIIKIESDSEVEEVLDKMPVETAVKMKINGAHAAPMEKEEEEQEQEEEATEQLSVIANNAGNEVVKLEQNNCRISSRSSSTVSSTSQQLVIDQPESEQQQLLQLQQQQLQVATTTTATKRRRSSNNSNNNESSNKKERLEAPTASLLMQRLQAPNTHNQELETLLSCYKCNANSFDNFQQLNAHYAQCGQPREEITTETTANSTAKDATPVPLANPLPSLKKERFFRCARCSTVHQCWNFFLHMRQVHQRYICLYCSHVFASVEKLSLHLENKHDMDQRHFNTVEAWQTLQTLEDRARYLVCCNCQASFQRGAQFEDHDCAELMQPCALCGQKAGHAVGCRNGSSPSNRKKVTVRRKRRLVKSKQQQQQQQEHQEEQQVQEPQTKEAAAAVEITQPTIVVEEQNIPSPAAEPTALPKLVVPKIMLRVPKEFQKSVDAALSSTDTEEEDNDELPAAATDDSSPALLLTVDAVQQQQQQLMLPASNRSEDTETATETASTFLEATTMPANAVAEPEDDDSSTDKLTLMVAELERTKRHIERTKAHIMAKQEQQLQQEEQQLQQEELQQQQRQWSPTPPASPHNNQSNVEEQEKQVPKEREAEMAVETGVATGVATELATPQRRDSLGSECMDIDDSLMPEQTTEPTINSPLPPADGIEVASEETHTVDLQLDRPLDKFEMVDFVRLCLKAVYPYCLYCNHARRIAVNGKQLVLHLIKQHRFTATVDSITAEELQAETIVSKLKSYLPAMDGGHYLNSASCCTLENGRFALPFNERIYECFQCRYVTATHKELYTHNRRLHTKAAITCCMCRINFYSYSELLCHICPGVTTSNIYEIQFRCCLCETTETQLPPTLPSAFRLMVHLRKQHQTCDICLEDCHSQAKLSSHVWKHKLLHLCYRCGIAYRNKQDISKHLFWKHGTESAGCKRCLQKRWRHVYHFCVPANQFTCEHCQFSFSKAIYLEVHKRQHMGDFRYACNEEQCEEKFVSRKLLLKHATQHEVKESPANSLENMEGTQTLLDKEEQRRSRSASEQPEQQKENEQGEGIKLEQEQLEASGEQQQLVKDKTPQPAEETQEKQQQQQTPRKRRKKNKRSKACLEDLNLIAPNLSESDSSDDSDSDAAGAQQELAAQQGTLPMRSSVDDLDMPRVMLSPASESDNEEQQDKEKELLKQTESETKPEQEEQLLKQPKPEAADEEQKPPKVETSSESQEQSEEVADIWKHLLQHQPTTVAKTEQPEVVEKLPSAEQLRPSKLHVICSDHDYCKMQRTPPPTPAPSPKKLARSTPSKSKRGNASSDSDSSSSSSSNSDSDSSSCSCGSNCSCSSSGSSSSDDDSDNESSCSGNAKKALKKPTDLPATNHTAEEEVNVTSVNEEEPRPATPSPKAPLYNESDFDTAVSDTDEEFYDAHPQKMANELLAQKRLALLSSQAHEQLPGESSNYDIVENSRPSTPSLPEEAAAYADKRERVSKNKKRKRERKSTCKSANQGKLPQLPPARPPMMETQTQLSAQLLSGYNDASTATATPFQQLLPDPSGGIHNLTPLTHRPGGWQPRMSEGSSCSDADGQLKRSKRTRRPNKFYGYTSDDENMSSVLAPPLQVGMQLIKPQPPPQLTWAKEDLPTPAKQQRSREHHGNHQHHNGSGGGNGSTRKRQKRTPLSGGNSNSAKRAAKRVKQQTPNQQQQQLVEQVLPPIPTLKIRPALLAAASVAASESSESSSEEEDEDESAEINVTSLPLNKVQAVGVPTIPTPLPTLPVALPPPPPPPATRAFNQPIPPALLPNPDFATLQYFKANNIRYPIRPPAGARLAREGESVYCYCRCPYDEVSEMIACDGDNCLIEWFHFECVGIMVAPQGKWFCAECRPKYSEGLYLGVKK